MPWVRPAVRRGPEDRSGPGGHQGAGPPAPGHRASGSGPSRVPSGCPGPGSRGSSTPCTGTTPRMTPERPQKVRPGRDRSRPDVEFRGNHGRRAVGLGGSRREHPADPGNGPRDRSAATARGLWDALPRGYRTGGTVYTDFLASYRVVIPKARHRAVGKDTGRTAHVERFWLTLRQRCARFVRKALTFSKCPRNHLGAVSYFIRLYNMSRP